MLEMLLIILVGGGFMAAVYFAAQIYHWYLDSKNAEEKQRKLFKEIDEANSEVSKLRNKIFEKDNIINSQKDEIDSLKLEKKLSKDLVDLYKSKIEEKSREKAVEMANDMASQHKLIRYYSEADINAFSKYFKSELLNRYFDAIRNYKFVRAFTQDIRLFSAEIDVKAKVTSAEDKNELYDVTLKSCSCKDFERYKVPCKHMLFLAMQIGVLPYRKDIINSQYQKIVEWREDLEQKEAEIKKTENKLARREESPKAKKKKT